MRNLTSLMRRHMSGAEKELTPGQVAKILKVSHSTVIRLEKDPDPTMRLKPARRLPRRGDRRYAPADVERVRKAMEAAPDDIDGDTPEDETDG